MSSLSTFSEIAFLLAMAAGIGLVGMLLRQPLIVSFIAVGLVTGPAALNLVHLIEPIQFLSELGIVILLFLVGIKLDVHLIRSLGMVSVFTGLGQVIFTTLFGWLMGLALGLNTMTSLYVAVALTFSSTIIIVKMLSEKREIDSLHGQIAFGLLIVQDLVVVFAMIMLSAIGIGSPGHGAGLGNGSIGMVLLSGLAMLACVVVLVRYVANPLTERLAQAPELLVIFAIALAAVLAAVGDVVGLGKEVGGLLAGVALASTPYRETIAARLAPLRDFLLLFFFIALGATLDLSLLGANIGAALVFSLFVLVGKPLIVLVIMGAMGFRKRTAFLTGITLAQISEFSLIFITMGVAIGHVSQQALGLVTMVGLITIAVSSYMITFSHPLYDLCERWLGVFERRGTPREAPGSEQQQRPIYPVIIFGLGRFGTAIALRLQHRGVPVLGIDINPQAVKRWRDYGLEAHFGDATDAEFVAELPLRHAQWVLATVPIHPTGLSHEDVRHTLIQLVQSTGFKGKIAAASHSDEDTGILLQAGIDEVLEPFQDAADRAVDRLQLQPAAN